MIVYIEKQNEIFLIKEIKKLKPDVIIGNLICEYLPINNYLDPICDNCCHQDYNHEFGYEFCELKNKKLE